MDNQQEENPECLSFKEKLKRFQAVPFAAPPRGLKKPDKVYNNDPKANVKVLPDNAPVLPNSGQDDHIKEQSSSIHVTVRQKTQNEEQSIEFSSDYIEISEDINDSDFVEYDKSEIIEKSSQTITDESEAARGSDSMNIAIDEVVISTNDGESIKKGTCIQEENFVTQVNQHASDLPRGLLQRQSNVTETSEPLSTSHLQKAKSLPPYPTPPYPVVDSITAPHSASVRPMFNFQPPIGFEGIGGHPPMNYTSSTPFYSASQHHSPNYMIEPKMPMPNPEYSVSKSNTNS